MQHPVEITAKALNEIDEALAWYAGRSIKAAIRWYVKLMEAIRSLADNPERFGLAPESESCSAEIRQMLYGKRRGIWRVLFEIRGDTVYILRVRHSAQDLLEPEEL